ncbi:HNH endonuclease signature motif containing protein [Nocardioides daejeonensis]|uniref:HNH endonuclease signature motif containing protein n=1 Tax=Nocardioides daejeonensis TaxID=1046556 RepID=UPI000D74E72D|nr:HNH endonuclease signature motif containing protein [Nocardioides daejeonensis]
MFAHLSLTDLLALTGQPPEGFGADPGDDVGIVSTDRLGQILTTQLRDWLRRHGSLATVAPVIDMARGRDPSERTDSHDPPGWLDTQVRLRDPNCVYPGCRRSSWDCDLDHIDPYVPPDAGGPPGQTRSENLAPLCRRHHLVKTTGRWRYRRLADGSYLWTNRHQQRWLVSPDGATPLE